MSEIKDFFYAPGFKIWNLYVSNKVFSIIQGWKLTSVRRPLADVFQSGLMIFAIIEAQSARLADGFQGGGCPTPKIIGVNVQCLASVILRHI